MKVPISEKEKYAYNSVLNFNDCFNNSTFVILGNI